LVDTQPELFPLEDATQEMNGIQTIPISDAEVRKILTIEEGHFVDVKAIEASPGKLTKAIAALSNAEGGELFIGIDEDSAKKKRAWRGFSNLKQPMPTFRFSNTCSHWEQTISTIS
jgi:hypothetical protein